MTLAAASGPSRAAVAAAFATVYLVWGSTYLAIRFAIETVPPMLMAGTRFLVAGLLLFAWARGRGAPRPALAHWGAAAAVGGLLLCGGNGAVVIAETRVDSGIAALVVATVPLWMVLLDWLRPGGARPPWGVMAGVAAGFAGVTLLVSPGSLAGSTGVDPVGAAILVFAAFSWSVGSLYSRRAALPPSPLLATAMEMLCGGVLLLVGGLLVGEGGALAPAAISLRSALGLGYLIVFGSILAFSCYVWLLRVSSPATVSTYAYVNPVVAVLLGWALAGESLGARTLLASAVIVGSVVVITTFRARPAVAADPAAATGGGAVPQGRLAR